MPWYTGGTLMHKLETIEIDQDNDFIAPRFPVQYVIRPESTEYHDYRGYAGRVAGGVFKKGDTICVLPSGLTSKIKSIDTATGELKEAFPPLSVTIQLEDDIDISRGDMIVKPEQMPSVTQDVNIMMCWMNQRPLQLNGKYIVKHTTREVRCVIKEIHYKVNVNNLEHIVDDKIVRLNDIARVSIRTTMPLFTDPYKTNRITGALILIDEGTNETVGVGMVE